MRDRNIGWILVIAVLVALLVATLCYCSGCALLTKHSANMPPPAGATPAGSDTPRSDPPRAEAGVAQPSVADQQGGVNTAVQGLTAMVDAKLAEFHKTVLTTYDTDVWLTRSLVLGVLVMAWYFAWRYGYDSGRKRRLQRENEPWGVPLVRGAEPASLESENGGERVPSVRPIGPMPPMPPAMPRETSVGRHNVDDRYEQQEDGDDAK